MMATKVVRRNPVAKVRKTVDVDDVKRVVEIDNSAKRIADDFVKENARKDRKLLYEGIFAEGARIGLDPEGTMEFLRQRWTHGKSFSTEFLNLHLESALHCVQEAKAVEDNTVDDLVKWRQAVRERLITGTNNMRKRRKDFHAAFLAFVTEYNKTVKKRQKDIAWYNKVSKALAGKIKGMKSFEKFESESLDIRE
jgi:hypothetical protein